MLDHYTQFHSQEYIDGLFRDHVELAELKTYFSRDPYGILLDAYMHSLNGHSLQSIFQQFPILIDIFSKSEHDPDNNMTLFLKTLFPAPWTEQRDLLHSKYDIMIRELASYPISMRARNDMSFVSVKNMPKDVVPRLVSGTCSFIPVHTIEVVDELVVFPVTRYIEDRTTGSGYIWGWYEQGERQGTFYYYEPGSITYLMARKTLYAPNRSFALFFLTTKDEFNKIYAENDPNYPENDWIDSIIKAVLPDPGYLDAYSIQEIYVNMWLSGTISSQPWNLIDSEMTIDKDITIMARRKGIDVVVLSAPKEGVIPHTEILDVRDRKVSYDNLYRM